jgi:hypothetical protein
VIVEILVQQPAPGEEREDKIHGNLLLAAWMDVRRERVVVS